MKQTLQVIFTTILLALAGILFGACNSDDEYWETEDTVLTDEEHGSLTNHHIVAYGGFHKDLTSNSVTIPFSANYNYKESLGISPGVIYMESRYYKYTSNLKFGEPNTHVVSVRNFTSSTVEVTLDNLKPRTEYAFRVYAIDAKGNEHYEEIWTFTTLADYTAGKAVDLGLSVKWADHNVGTSQPEDWGTTFYWGGIEEDSGSSKIDWHDYLISTLQSYGYIDSNNNLCPAYDAATQKWGANWRMPTKEECQELIDKCSWKETTKDGKQVFLVTGPNGNFIYLPSKDNWDYKYSSFRDDDYSLKLFWSSTDAFCIRTYKNLERDNFMKNLYAVDRSTRLNIRPVMK